jgi:uncharacterized membrane protein
LSVESEIPGLTKGRVEALSDGIFATVMTVLVLGLSIPVIAGAPPDISLLQNLAPNILSYVLSYMILTVMWVSHHNVFHYIARLNRPLTWLNSLFLLTIGFIPFSTTLLGHYPMAQISVVIYGINIAGVALAMQALMTYAMKSKLLVAEGPHYQFIRTILTRWRIGTVIYSSAILVSFISWGISVAIYVIASAIFVVSSTLTLNLPRAKLLHNS